MIPTGAKTQVLAANDGDLTSKDVAPMEVAVRPMIGPDGSIVNFETIAHFILEEEDVAAIAAGGREVWYRVIGDHFHPMSLQLDKPE